MVATETLLTLAVAGLASLFMAWAIGAGSSGSTPFAPAVGANAISVMRAGFVVGLLGLAGAFLQGANVTEAVGTELVVGAPLTPVAAIVGLLTAAILVAIGVFTGYPIATAFTVTGAVVGAGLALGRGPAWAKYAEVATLWLLVPFVGGGIAFGTATLLRNERVSEAVAVPVLAAFVGLLLANIEFVLLGPGTSGRGLAAAVVRAVLGESATGTPVLAGKVVVTVGFAALLAALLRADLRRDEDAGQRHFLLALG
jgi:PiT family inorganic phosphate transporter